MILNDDEIEELCVGLDPLISPFTKERVEGAISFGLSSAGYDLTLDRKVLVFKPTRGEAVIDPKRFKDPAYCALMFDSYDADGFIVVPPHSYVLVQSVERFSMPDFLVGICLGKSTYARCGVIVNTTPLEPAWKGTLTIEISNSAPLPVKLYVDEGIAQVLFHRVKPPRRTYAGKGGKYQDQTTVTPAR